MSAIGISVVENGRISWEFGTIINPECRFDYYNTVLTGISAALAADYPPFPEVWEQIEGVMSGGVLIAHNAPFDMSVLSKCLRGYGICWRDRAQYACTCRMSRRCYPELCDHKLNTLCDYFDIKLDHHRAVSDAHAAAELLIRLINDGADIKKYIKEYDLASCRTVTGKR
ncbi:MAG: exonuclease [Oscillospiraceae bacterium]|nr:exonuclease [Oscillospiraceae bacterium]